MILKWIGEHVWDFISRFRNDIYLENSAKITTSDDGDVVIDPGGTGSIQLISDDIRLVGGGGLLAADIKLYESPLLEGNYVQVASPLSLTSDYTLTLPDGAGAADQVLKTNGLGTLSWTDALLPDNPTVNGILSVKPLGGDARLALYEDDGNNYVIVQAQDSLSSNWTMELPNDAGTSRQVLETNGSGVTRWADQPKEYWHETVGGYRTNWSNSTTYYTFYRVWYENWANVDSTPTSISYSDYTACFFRAPRAGSLTNIMASGYSTATDPFKFYVYKATPVDNASSIALTAMVTSSTITPPGANKTWNYTEDFSSGNTFSEGDMLFIWVKKDSHSATQHTYWSMNINGEYD